MTEIVTLGAGRMGRGIAQAFAYAGHPVTILDFKARSAAECEQLLREAVLEVEGNLELLRSLGMVSDRAFSETLGRIELAPLGDAQKVLADARYVFEGVPETTAAKQDAFRRLGTLASPDVIVASTSSTMGADELATYLAYPSSFLNAHFLNPAYLIPLVEVSPNLETLNSVLEAFNQLLESIGKVPVVCRNSPGYIVSRLQALVMNESIRMVEEGVAAPEEIDRAVRTGFGLRYSTMGTVEFTDWGGIDILYYATTHLGKALGERYTLPESVGRFMEEGKLGLTSGKGYYDYTDIDVDAYRREKLGTFVGLLRHMELLPVSPEDSQR